MYVCMYISTLLILFSQGRFSLAARYHSTVAEIFETEVQDYEEAITHYELAADFYKGEDSIGYVCCFVMSFEECTCKCSLLYTHVRTQTDWYYKTENEQLTCTVYTVDDLLTLKFQIS